MGTFQLRLEVFLRPCNSNSNLKRGKGADEDDDEDDGGGVDGGVRGAWVCFE